MAFDVDQVDRLLTTTRAVRKKLDFERDVPTELLLDLIDVAEQAPSGSNQASRRWLIVRDPATKKELAALPSWIPQDHQRRRRAWRTAGPDSIEIASDVDRHVFRISTGYPGRAKAVTTTSAEARPGAPIKTLYAPASGCSASCCG